MTSRADIEAEKAVSSFFDANGLVYFAWPQAQTKPDGITNRTVFNVENIRILKVEQVEVDANNNLVEPSPIEIKR
jgi:GH43 family beta-xylosidase